MWMLVGTALAVCGTDLNTQLEAIEGVDAVTVEAVDDLLACFRVPLTPDLAGRIHALYARGYGGDPGRAAAHLYAAWEARPFAPPGLPADHPAVHQLEILQEGLPPAPAAAPMATLQIDGSRSTWVREGQPYLAHVEGQAPQLVDRDRPFRAPGFKPAKKSSGLLVAGLVTGGVAAGMYGGAWATRSRYEDLVASGGPNDSRQLNYDWTNALSVGSVVGALAGAGLLTVHVVR